MNKITSVFLGELKQHIHILYLVPTLTSVDAYFGNVAREPLCLV